MKIVPINDAINIRVALSKGKVFEADLRKELSIDTKNLREEVLSHPAKQAWWSVLSDLAEQKVMMATDKLSSPSDEAYNNYITACKQYELLYRTKTAFSCRLEVLLQLWDNPSNLQVAEQFTNQISNLGALYSA